MPLNANQKAAITQFVTFTHADKKVAEKMLRSHNWVVDLAVNSFFQSTPNSGGNPKTEAALNKLFDKYRDDPKNSPDMIQMSGAAPYFGDLGINMGDPDISLLVISELLHCPSLGDIPRQSYISGWSPINATSIAAQQTHLRQLVSSVSSPAERCESSGLYRRVYKHTFEIACPTGSKSLPLEQAQEFWRHLFGPKGFRWIGADGTDWAELYLAFLDEKWKKAVNKDLWNQTLLFALKVSEDETLVWWSEEDSAWPGIVDEFILEMKARGVGKVNGDAMDES